MSFGIDVFSGWRALKKFVFLPVWRLIHPKPPRNEGDG
jgi:hypothetical protein